MPMTASKAKEPTRPCCTRIHADPMDDADRNLAIMVGFVNRPTDMSDTIEIAMVFACKQKASG